MAGRHLYRALLICLCASVSYAHAQYEMHFFCPDFPPYTTIDSDGNQSGIGLDRMKPILEVLGVDYSISIGSNHGRALAELKNGRSDGFFMASRNDERDKYAVFSESIMTNRWVWVRLAGSGAELLSVAKPGEKVASLLNANTNRWLMKSGYDPVHPAENIRQLVGMLDSQQVSAVLVAEEVFKAAYPNDTRYQITLQVEKEFGVYISKTFLESHPQFMDELNAAIRAQ